MPETAQNARLTTTFHHPFYDETQSAFVDAKDLHTGDVLQTPTGTTKVTGVRLYHANTTTYDLTIGTLHTYYVEAGDTPVLVHNCQVEYGSTDLSAATAQERLRLGKTANNFAAARYKDAEGVERIAVRYSSAGRGNHAEAKLLRDLGKRNCRRSIRSFNLVVVEKIALQLSGLFRLHGLGIGRHPLKVRRLASPNWRRCVGCLLMH